MRYTKLTAAAVALIFSTFLVSSCDREDIEAESLFVGNGLPMTGAQEVPAVVTSANGTISASYSKLSRLLTYKVFWGGLSGSVAAAHIHGTALAGYNATFLQTFPGFPGPLYGISGSYSGTVYMDGIIFKEEELLADRYYINLHTALRPGGEIRGQIILRQ